MEEEGDPWAFDETEQTTDKTAEGGEAAPAEGAPTSEGAQEAQSEQPPPPPAEDDTPKPLQLYRHWVRPKFLQYKYMYNYRTNYYDDVIDYLDKKQKGLCREIPRPQTWAERVLRTTGGSRSLDEYRKKRKDDSHLIQTLAASINSHNYHSKAYINRKYSSVI